MSFRSTSPVGARPASVRSQDFISAEHAPGGPSAQQHPLAGHIGSDGADDIRRPRQQLSAREAYDAVARAVRGDDPDLFYQALLSIDPGQRRSTIRRARDAAPPQGRVAQYISTIEQPATASAGLGSNLAGSSAQPTAEVAAAAMQTAELSSLILHDLADNLMAFLATRSGSERNRLASNALAVASFNGATNVVTALIDARNDFNVSSQDLRTIRKNLEVKIRSTDISPLRDRLVQIREALKQAQGGRISRFMDSIRSH